MTCVKCSKCCRYLFFETDLSKKTSQELRLEKLRGVKHFKSNVMAVPVSCKHLKGNKCNIYDKRPLICRSFSCNSFKYGKELKSL